MANIHAALDTPSGAVAGAAETRAGKRHDSPQSMYMAHDVILRFIRMIIDKWVFYFISFSSLSILFLSSAFSVSSPEIRQFMKYMSAESFSHLSASSCMASMIGATRLLYLTTRVAPDSLALCTSSGNTFSTSWATTQISSTPEDFHAKLYPLICRSFSSGDLITRRSFLRIRSEL